jgi:hypothetical protein
MNDAPETDSRTQARLAAAPDISWVALLARMLARAWIVLLLLTAAALGGMAVTQVFVRQAELEALRQAPGPNSYAVLAYRAELQRQIEAISADRTMDAAPTPPARPLLLEEIDLARARNAAIVQSTRSESLGTISAPP